jgi:hypothetical protein
MSPVTVTVSGGSVTPATYQVVPAIVSHSISGNVTYGGSKPDEFIAAYPSTCPELFRARWHEHRGPGSYKINGLSRGLSRSRPKGRSRQGVPNAGDPVGIASIAIRT